MAGSLEVDVVDQPAAASRVHEIERLNPVALRALKLDPKRHRIGATRCHDRTLEDTVSVMRHVDLDDRKPLDEDRIGEADRAIFVPPQPAHGHQIFCFDGGEKLLDGDGG